MRSPESPSANPERATPVVVEKPVYRALRETIQEVERRIAKPLNSIDPEKLPAERKWLEEQILIMSKRLALKDRIVIGELKEKTVQRLAEVNARLETVTEPATVAAETPLAVEEPPVSAPEPELAPEPEPISEPIPEPAPVPSPEPEPVILPAETVPPTEEVPVARIPRNKKVVIVENKEALEMEARDAADAYMTASKKELSGFKGFVSKIWKHNLFHEYYRQKEIAAAKQNILAGKNLYATESVDRAVHEQSMAALMERFGSEYEETLHIEAGEARRNLNKETTEKLRHEAIKTLVKDYASGALDKDAFIEEKNRIISSITGVDRSLVDSEVAHADNLFEIARQVKEAVEHGARLEELDLDFDVVIGKAKTGVRTEAQFNTVDRIVNKLSSTKVGQLVNETTLASAVAITYSLTAGLSQRVARSKAAAWGTFGVTALIAGGVAGARESKRLEEERRQHFREMAKGKKFDPESSPRRKEMEEHRYDTESAVLLAAQINENIDKRDLNQEEALALLGQVASAEARIKLSDKSNIDLLAYTDFRSVEQERLSLDIARAKAKVELRKMVESGSVTIPDGKTFDEFLTSCIDTKAKELTKGDEGIEAKDRTFSKMKRKRVAVAALKGLASGLVIGGAFQEGAALLRDNEQGIIEGAIKGSRDLYEVSSITPLERLRHVFAGAETDELPGDLVDHAIPGGGVVKLPEGVELVPDPENPASYSLVSDGEVIVTDLHTAGGQLTPESIALLSEEGILTSTDIEKIVEYAEANETASQYVEEHKDLFHKIHRSLWYDNDTPAPVFDKNELDLQWGGGGDGLDEHGNYVFNALQMQADGSYHKEFSIDAQQAIKEGKLKMLLSLSRDTQTQVVEIPIDTQGNAVIDPNSEIGKLFFEQVDGKAVFVGKYAEVVESVGRGEDGIERFRMLATHVGEGRDSLIGTVPVPKETPVTVFDFPESKYFVAPPPFIPIFGRSPLEKLNKKGIIPIPYYYMSGDVSPERRKQFSETIKSNPSANLDHYKEADKYLSTWDEDYKEKINGLAEQAGEMSRDCRIVVNIPVAGHQEGENIYRSLKNLTNQTINPKNFELLLFVNRPNIDKEGRPVSPDKTLDEINRFKQDYPEINVRVMESVLPINEAKIGNIRKLLNDAALVRHNKRGKSVPDVIMVSNDADNKGMSPQYLDNFLNKFDENSNVDAFLGQIDWDPESYIRNPLTHIGTRLFQYINLQMRRSGRHIESSGANFAFRSSIYSAVGGGYSPDTEMAEDNQFGAAIRAARLGSSAKIPIAYAGARVSRLYTSSRRAEKAVKDGLSPVEQWDRGFSAFDDEVRKVKWEEMSEGIDFNDVEQVEKLIREFETVFNRTIKTLSSWYKIDIANHPSLKKALGWLGVRYEIDGKNGIKITDATKLVEGLKQYQEEGMEIMEYKTGKREKIERASNTPASEAPLEAPAQPEQAAQNVETQEVGEMEFSFSEIGDVIRSEIGNRATVKKLEFTEVPGGAAISGELDAGLGGGKIKLEGVVENSGDNIAINNVQIEARGYVKTRIEKVLADFSNQIKKKLEEKYNRPVTSLKIEGSKLVIK